MKKISVVIPVYYEEDGLAYLKERLWPVLGELQKRGLDWEIVFIDDGSKDKTAFILKNWANEDNKIKVVRFVRNFGSHVAIKTGYRYATGDCAVNLCADLQEPPELMLQMVDAWQNEKADVILLKRLENKGGFSYKLFSKLFYFIINKMSSLPDIFAPIDMFFLDRKVLNNLNRLNEHNICIHALILWLGYDAKEIYFKREERKFGTSGWTLSKKIKMFFDSLIAVSYLPIRFFSIAGLCIIFLSFIYGIFLTINRLFIDHNLIPGWTTIILLILFIGGMLILGIGILGEYLWRTLDEARNRPNSLVLETINVEEEKNK